MLAYSLAVHKNPLQVRRLMKSLYTPEDFFYINIFGAASERKQYEWMDCLNSFEHSNVFFSFKYSDGWGTIDQVKANLDAMMKFRDENYSHFINLSGQCYPVASIRLIKEFLSKNNHSYMAFNKMPDYCAYAKDKKIYCPPNTRFHYRFEYCYYPLPKWKVFRRLSAFRKDTNTFIKIPRLNKKLLSSIELYKGSNWFCLHKDHVKYILDFLTDNPDYIKFFSTVLCSDEHFFQTILLNSSCKSHIMNDNLRYIVWNAEGSSPVVLGTKDLRNILESKKHFARKFDSDIDSTVLDLIDVENKN
jgi:hypothetical protein